MLNICGIAVKKPHRFGMTWISNFHFSQTVPVLSCLCSIWFLQRNCLCMIHADKWMLLCLFILLTSLTLTYLHSSLNINSRLLLEFKLQVILSHACHIHAHWITLTYLPQIFSNSVIGTLHFLVFCFCLQRRGIKSVGLGNLYTWNSAVLFCHTREQKRGLLFSVWSLVPWGHSAGHW